LANNQWVKNIYYPGLVNHPGYHLHQQQTRGNGTVISFTTDSLALSNQIVEKTQLFTLSVSFGSLTSFISLPSAMSHASIPESKRTLPRDLIRLSIGIEDADDLIADLEQTFKEAIKSSRLATMAALVMTSEK
jgi:cystathionine beta-lyase